MSQALIELDELGRAALKYGAKPGTRYIATFLPDGSIHLTPAVVVAAAAEAAMRQQNPHVAAYLASGAFDGEEIDLAA